MLNRRQFLGGAAAVAGLQILPHGALGADAELPVVSDKPGAFSFAVLGDTHYTRPDYKVTRAIEQIAADIRSLSPEVRFICHTGDVAEGGVYVVQDGKRRFALANYEEMKAELEFAARHLNDTFRLPLFVAVGNHDKHDPGYRAYHETFLPRIARHVGQPLEKTSYAFRYGNTCFVFLEFAPRDPAAQAAYLDGVLTAAKKQPGIEHVLLFAHYPLWVVARSGFASARLTDSLMPVLLKHRPDAWFCGHTHNVIVSVRRFSGVPLTEIQGVSTHINDKLIPIEQRHAPLFPAAETPHTWGYVEGSSGGYHLVRVDGQRVTVQWRVPGRGVVYQCAWEKPGELIDIQRPAITQPRLTPEMLKTVAKASIALYPWAEDRTPITLSLNGQPLVQAELKPTYSSFWDETRIAIPADKLSILRRANRLEIGNPSRAAFAVAHVRLEVTLADGTLVTSPVSSDFLFSCRDSETAPPPQRKARQAAPESLRREVDLGQPLPPIELRLGCD